MRYRRYGLRFVRRSTEFPVIRTTPEDTRILHFLVTGEKEKRVAIVARVVAEREGDERELRRTLTWTATG